MKKYVLLGLWCLLLLGACNAKTPTNPLTIRELTVVPDNIQQNIEANDKVQLLYEDDSTYYLVYYSKGNVLASIEAEGNSQVIQLKEGSEQRKEAQPYVFKIITKDPALDTIDLRVNGQSTPIVRVTSI
ncbi:hypothetical protein [Lysinibacillus cavernae]|uniref:hypothetical protein n=1 Tax=Lysinibacillus cavernae TaxID=2666135 RepID=UPI0012D9D7A4|nr:hypothetical protein [Lysinibacillus cavernae]